MGNLLFTENLRKIFRLSLEKLLITRKNSQKHFKPYKTVVYTTFKNMFTTDFDYPIIPYKIYPKKAYNTFNTLIKLYKVKIFNFTKKRK